MIALLLLTATAAAQPAPTPPKVADPELYPRGVDRLRAGAAPQSAALLHEFLDSAPETDVAWGPAQLEFGKALVKSGLRHAGANYLSRVALDRTDPRSVPEAVAQLIALTKAPHDATLIEGRVFATLDVGFLPPESAAPIHFEQGLRHLRSGNLDWSRKHFSRLPEGSPEAVKAQLAQELHALERNRSLRPQVLKKLGELSDAPGLATPVRNEVLLALARLRYEAEDYEGALAAYQRIELPKLDPGQATRYREEAWTRYRLGQLPEALGMLVALDSPAFRDEFLPEKYLLRAFIYRDTCHYHSAKRTIQTLPRKFASSLETIEERGELTADRPLLTAALTSGEARESHAFLRSLEKERASLAKLEPTLGKPLTAHLRELYDAALGEARRRNIEAIDEAVQARADQLLDLTEKGRLLEYEIGLALNGRGGQPAVKATTASHEVGPGETVFRFRGEYWNDELRNHRVLLENRCTNGGV